MYEIFRYSDSLIELLIISVSCKLILYILLMTEWLVFIYNFNELRPKRELISTIYDEKDHYLISTEFDRSNGDPNIKFHFIGFPYTKHLAVWTFTRLISIQILIDFWKLV